jgi:hypothetical protein
MKERILCNTHVPSGKDILKIKCLEFIANDLTKRGFDFFVDRRTGPRRIYRVAGIASYSVRF